MAGTTNTIIQILRSDVTPYPSSLSPGEQAYSYVSNKLFVGNTDNSVVTIGGKYYVDLVDNATSSSTGNTIVRRDDAGNATFTMVSVNDDPSNSTDAVNKGYLESVLGGISSNTIYDGTIGVDGYSNVHTSSADGGSVIITANNTVAASFSTDTINFNKNVEITGGLSVTGNLIVSGDTTYVNTSINLTYDSLIELAANNTVGDVLDIGFYGKHEGVDGTAVTGLVRNAGTSDYYLFDNINIGDQADLSANVITQSAMIANGASLFSKGFFAAEGGVNGTGFSFGIDQDTGMFSSGDGHLEFFSNSVKSGEINPSNGGTSLGQYSASTNQGYRATAIGYGAGQTNQGGWATAIGLNAGNSGQGNSTVAVGHRAGGTNQTRWAVAVGVNSGQNTQGEGATALGYRAGYGATSGQGAYSVALGAYAGIYSQAAGSIAINASGSDLSPPESGLYIDPIRANNAIGGNVTVYNTSTKEVVSTDVFIDGSGIKLANGTYIADSLDSVIVGQNIDLTNTNTNRVAIGDYAGQTNQGYGSTALGKGAGSVNQDYLSVAIGLNAANTNQGHSSVAIGHTAGRTSQGYDSVAIGVATGLYNQGHYSVAIGERAGYGDVTPQGDYSIAIGSKAGYSSMASESIILNANTEQLNSSNPGLYVNPVRNVTSSNIMFYDAATKEITYGLASVDYANTANVAYYGNTTEATGGEVNRHTLALFHGVSGNTPFQANTLLTFDTANTTLEIGYSAYTPLPNTLVQTTGSSSEYVQNNIQNLNNNGSADWVVTADNGSDTNGYLDMGMAGGNYDYITDAGETGPFKPNDGWIQVVGNTGVGKGNLLIMTGTSNTSVTEVGSIKFSLGNQAFSNIFAYMSRVGDSPTGTATFAIGKNSDANYDYALDVVGGANVASIAINDTQILAENYGLPVSFGGTGLQSVTSNAILYGNGTGALIESNAPTLGQVLQYRSDGVMFGGLDGGTF